MNFLFSSMLGRPIRVQNLRGESDLLPSTDGLSVLTVIGTTSIEEVFPVYSGLQPRSSTCDAPLPVRAEIPNADSVSSSLAGPMLYTQSRTWSNADNTLLGPAFEIVTPTQGKRMYQATSTEEAKAWIYAISNAVEAVLNGTTSSYRKQDHAASAVATDRTALEHEVTRPIGLGFPTLMEPQPESSRLYLSDAPVVGQQKPLRKKPSFKEVLRGSRTSLGFGPSKTKDDSLSSGQLKDNVGRLNLNVPSQMPNRRSFDYPSRQSSRSSHSSSRAFSIIGATDDGGGRGSRGDLDVNRRRSSGYNLDLDEEMRRTIQLFSNSADTSRSVSPDVSAAYDPRARRRSGGQLRTASPLLTVEEAKSTPVTATGPPTEPSLRSPGVDMSTLRRIADLPSNQSCADCARSLVGEYSQRWATVSLHNRAIVMFICQRCAGIHRGLGSHISKVRSPDLDNWTEEMILTAKASGNQKGNSIWERERPSGSELPDLSLPTLKTFIERKYAQGIWLNAEDRVYYLGDVEHRGIAL